MPAQEEYAREGIDWSYVEFIDNQDCLDVLEGAQDAPSLAVFPLIDEACRLPRATYQVRPASVRSHLKTLISNGCAEARCQAQSAACHE